MWAVRLGADENETRKKRRRCEAGMRCLVKEGRESSLDNRMTEEKKKEREVAGGIVRGKEQRGSERRED